MPGTFFGIEIGRSGLNAAQIGQDVTGNNIANAGTAGYSVQSVSQVAADQVLTDDHAAVPKQEALGTGVLISSIQRARDQFLDTQVRTSTGYQSLQTSLSDTLKQVDAAFGEPSNTGLNATIGKFFNSFQDLANNPSDLGVRATTIQQGNALASVFQGVQGQLITLGTTLSQHAATDVQTINDYSAQIAALNVTIKENGGATQPLNTVLDRRDLVLDKLAALTNISTQNNPDGTVSVSVGKTPLVLGTDAYPVTQSSLTSSGDLQSGELAGLTQAQTQVKAYQGQINNLAASLVSQVNAIQSTGAGLDGTTGLNFFSATAGSEASTIAVNPPLELHPEQLAAAAVPTPPASPIPPASDSTNATLLAGLQKKTVTDATSPLYNSTLLSYYQQTVSDAGGRAASASSAAASATASVTQLTQQRDSVTGVSTDSEMINMMKYQRAYQAAARFISTSDDMIGTLINNLMSAN
jgi:flagellar hook-associated protein 1 FlgK